MIQVFTLMMILGGFAFISLGICAANSIEAKESKTASNIMSALSALGAICLVIGFAGLLIIS